MASFLPGLWPVLELGHRVSSIIIRRRVSLSVGLGALAIATVADLGRRVRVVLRQVGVGDDVHLTTDGTTIMLDFHSSLPSRLVTGLCRAFLGLPTVWSIAQIDQDVKVFGCSVTCEYDSLFMLIMNI